MKKITTIIAALFLVMGLTAQSCEDTVVQKYAESRTEDNGPSPHITVTVDCNSMRLQGSGFSPGAVVVWGYGESQGGVTADESGNFDFPYQSGIRSAGDRGWSVNEGISGYSDGGMIPSCPSTLPGCDGQ